MLSGRSPGPLTLRSDRGERECGCGRRDEKVRLKHCSIGRSRERVPRESYCIELERRLRRGGRSARREFQRLGVNLPLQERQGPGDKEGGGGSERATLKSADKPFGIANL